MAKTKKDPESKQQIKKIQNGLYLVERGGVKLLATNNGTALKEPTKEELELLEVMGEGMWNIMQIAAMVAIDNMVKQEARK